MRKQLSRFVLLKQSFIRTVILKAITCRSNKNDIKFTTTLKKKLQSQSNSYLCYYKNIIILFISKLPLKSISSKIFTNFIRFKGSVLMICANTGDHTFSSHTLNNFKRRKGIENINLLNKIT